MIHFVTIANEKLSATRKRIIKEAVESEFFNEIHELNESALPQELRDYCENNGDWFSEVDEEVIDPYDSKAWKDNITSRYRII